jgi:prophage tail gpP-like protein
MSDIRLKVNGLSYGGWTSIRVSQSMDQICGTFGFASSDKYPGKPANWRILMGDYCEVSVEGTTICSGYVDDLPISYDAESHSLQIGGRDKTADLVDCSFVDPINNVNEWNNQTILKLIKNICDSFGISVTVHSSVASDLTETIKKFAANEADTAFDSILRLCKHRAVLPLSYGDGKLTLTRAGTKRAVDTLELGVNILSGDLSQSNKERFSKYIAKGQGNEVSSLDLASITEPYGEATDEIVTRYRPFVILAEGETNTGDCQALARFEARNRAGRSRSLNYTVQGWAQSNKKPWELNSTVRVRDPNFSIDGTKLISAIDFSYDDVNGELTILTLVDKETYELREEPIELIKTKFD